MKWRRLHCPPATPRLSSARRRICVGSFGGRLADATPTTTIRAMSSPHAEMPAVLAFGEFVLDVANARLLRAGQTVPLTPKPFAVLATLAQRPGELVSKDHLLDTVWRRRFVSDSAVKSVLSELRAVLGDDARSPRWVETVPARGYRFIGAVQPTTPPVPPRPVPGGGNLPLAATPLFGRDTVLQELLDEIQDRPSPALLTLTGPAGVGKSHLALALATARRSACPDGAWRVDLAGLPSGSDATQLRVTLAHALRLADAAARDDEALVQSLEGLGLLLLLDNAEHVVEALAPVLAQLLARVAGLTVLVTSREPLHLPIERQWRVPPLSVPDSDDEANLPRLLATGAVQLFLARTAARLPDFQLNPEQAPALATLCRALDGLPLALELAAARVATLGVVGLSRQLRRADEAAPFGEAAMHLRLLGPGSRRGEARHQTLREALDWSHALLAASQQRVLRRLAVFRGPFSLPAAQQVCRDDAIDDWAVLEAVEALVDRSWLVGSTHEPRQFHFLHSLWAYAHERLTDAGELPLVHGRHLQAVLGYWQQADARALGDPALQWAQQHEAAIPDLRVALAWAFDAVCASPPQLEIGRLLSLVGASGMLWHRSGRAAEGVRCCERALALAGPAAGMAERAGVDLMRAHLAGIAMVISAAQGLAAARQAAQAYRELGDAVRENYALYLQHTLMARAEPQADRSAVLARLAGLVQPGWSDLLRRFERSARAYEARLQGGHEAYRQFNAEELARCRALGAWWEAWSAGIGLMLAEHDAGRLAEAVAAGRDVLAEIRAAGRLRQNANRLAMWLMMLAESGDTEGTRAALAEALPLLHGAGRSGMALLSAGWLACHEGRPQLAARLLARFDAPHRTGAEFGPGTFIRRSIGLLWARLRAELGDAVLAEARAEAEMLSDGEVLRGAMAR